MHALLNSPVCATTETYLSMFSSRQCSAVSLGVPSSVVAPLARAAVARLAVPFRGCTPRIAAIARPAPRCVPVEEDDVEGHGHTCVRARQDCGDRLVGMRPTWQMKSKRTKKNGCCYCLPAQPPGLRIPPGVKDSRCRYHRCSRGPALPSKASARKSKESVCEEGALPRQQNRIMRGGAGSALCDPYIRTARGGARSRPSGPREGAPRRAARQAGEGEESVTAMGQRCVAPDAMVVYVLKMIMSHSAYRLLSCVCCVLMHSATKLP